MRGAAILAAAALTACAPTLTPLPRPAEGYEALRLLRPLEFPAIPTIRIAAGTLFVRDRANAEGAPLWCAGGGFDLNCLEFRDGRVRPYANAAAVGAPAFHDVAPGTFERTRL